ncbi:MAG: acyl carrier protein [Proteobacteria bacterium]|nr:acyl carrier protein [Pseudomonadota bacterium]
MSKAEDTIRAILEKHGRLPCAVASLASDADLYTAGLKSFASVQIMLALEEAFDLEFPERMLNRATFSSIAMIEQSIGELSQCRALAS